MCELVRGGINFHLLDPESHLLNFVIGQVSDFGTLSWFVFVFFSNIKKMNFFRFHYFRLAASGGAEDCMFIRSVFQFFAVLSHIECGGHILMEKNNMVILAENILNASKTRPVLSLFGLICKIVMIFSLIFR